MVRAVTGILIATCVFLPSCRPAGENGQGVSSADVKRDLKKAVDTTDRFITEQTEAFGRRVTERLREIDIDLDAWKRRLDEATAEERPELERKVLALENQREAVGRQVDELGETGRDAWRSASERLDRALTDLRNAARDEPR